MVKIVIENLGKKEVPVKDFTLTVLDHIHSNHIDWLHACGKRGRCTTCKMIVAGGSGNLSDLTEAEQKYRGAGALKSNERLACQTRTVGDLNIIVPDESKLPHLEYTSVPN